MDAVASLACIRTALFSDETPSVRSSFTTGSPRALLATLPRDAYDGRLDVFRKSTMNQMLQA